MVKMALLTHFGRDARLLGHSFPDGIQQDLPCERLAQIGDAPGVHRLIARGLVVVPRHEDDRALRSRCRKRRCSSIPEIPPRWMSSSKQVAVCALPLSSNASAEANVRASTPLSANSRVTPFRKPALSSTTITTVDCSAISMSNPGAVCVPRVLTDP